MDWFYIGNAQRKALTGDLFATQGTGKNPALQKTSTLPQIHTLGYK